MKRLPIIFLIIFLCTFPAHAFFQRGDVAPGFSYKHLKVYKSRSGTKASGIIVNHTGDNCFLALDLFFNKSRYQGVNRGRIEVDVPRFGTSAFDILLTSRDYQETKEAFMVSWNVKENWIIKGGMGTTIKDTAIYINGYGDKVTDTFKIPAGACLIKLRHYGKSNFAVVIRDRQGQWKSLLANKIGRYNGIKNFTVKHHQDYFVTIEADGKWSIEIRKPDPQKTQTATKRKKTHNSKYQNQNDYKKQPAAQLEPADAPYRPSVKKETIIFVLKNGRRIPAMSYQNEGDSWKLFITGGAIFFEKDAVKEIIE